MALRDAEAKRQGVMLLPGVGFDVVPSDCLAAHMKRRLPDASDLKLYISLGDDMSRGTAKTMIEAIAAGTRIRRGGRLVSHDRAEAGSCDFGEGERTTFQVSWGDVATAFHSTGIPNIEVHFEATSAAKALVRMPRLVKSFLGLGFMQSFLKAGVDRMPEGPGEAARRAGRAILVGVARNDRWRVGALSPEDAGGLFVDGRDSARRRSSRRRRRGQAWVSNAQPRVRRRLHPQLRGRHARGPQRLNANPPADIAILSLAQRTALSARSESMLGVWGLCKRFARF